ncbi:hypothetical protein SZ52_09055 [Brachyspira hyodysenteriae]|uniref:PD-(D/E)XK nuclease family protein n=3 Tax=Brachyspira hyodysenteriae TaxID=159 RepID=UPI00063DD39A|nr:PD-(D/E)XK nuclease family protein [Brachyspira hyodysenteriae]KLI41138.1 hypothetical protein SZ52_09055 [Brachyspira hyodysenteriae]
MNKTEAKNILTDIFNLKSYIEEEIAKLPTRFNIVDSIVGAHKETSNTKLLGSFLDCIFEKDYKFINSLLEYIKNNCNIDSFKEIDFYNEYITINIEKEVVINKEEKGKIDILLTSDNYNIIIENKINTRDSENQLQKYYNAIPNRTNTYLIYLTRNGDEPKNNFYNKEKLILLSHKTIIDWLESIKEKEEVKNNDSLYSAIIQIIETEQIITNSLEGDIMKEEIKKYFNNKYPNKFKEYPEVINYTKLLKSAIEAVADIFYNYFENNIEYYILKLINDSEIKKNNKIEYNKEKVKKEIYKSDELYIEAVSLETKFFRVVFEIGSDGSNFILYYGIRFNDKNKIELLRNIEDNILACFKNIDKDGCLSKPEEYIDSKWYIDYTLNLDNLEKEIENAKNNMINLYTLLKDNKL